MTKQEKINIAWSEIDSEFYGLASEEGWRRNSGVKYDTWDGRFQVNNMFHRPKSLEGIENNKGWIKINSESDLPKEIGNYDIFTKENELSVGFYSEENNPIKKYWIDNITHWQPSLKREIPLY